MEKVAADIKQELEKLAGKFTPATIITAEVKGVNSDDTIIAELSTGLVLDDVRLKSVITTGDKIVILPAIGSLVQIAAIENSNEYIVLATEAITKVNIKIGQTEFIQDANTFTFKKGSDSLAKIIGEVIDEINKVVVMVGTSPNVSALTAIKTRLNQLMQ